MTRTSRCCKRRRLYPSPAARRPRGSVAKGNGCVLDPLVGMQNHALATSLLESPVQGAQHGLGIKMVRHRQANGAPAENIKHTAN